MYPEVLIAVNSNASLPLDPHRFDTRSLTPLMCRLSRPSMPFMTTMACAISRHVIGFGRATLWIDVDETIRVKSVEERFGIWVESYGDKTVDASKRAFAAPPFTIGHPK